MKSTSRVLGFTVLSVAMAGVAVSVSTQLFASNGTGTRTVTDQVAADQSTLIDAANWRKTDSTSCGITVPPPPPAKRG